MSALVDFNRGFHDGYRGERRRRGQGAGYLRAFRRGVEAREREVNGGEDVAGVAARGRR